MNTIATQGLHHITFLGADKATSVDFWEGVLGMPFLFEQPNLDDPQENHLYFDPGDGRLVTVFVNENRRPDRRPVPLKDGAVHHVAFSVSQATFLQIPARLEARGIGHSGPQDRGFMNSIYFRDPMGMIIELASYRFEPPEGFRHADVLFQAHLLRVARGAKNIEPVDLADATAVLIASRGVSLSHRQG